jgi:hypothetical protein
MKLMDAGAEMPQLTACSYGAASTALDLNNMTTWSGGAFGVPGPPGPEGDIGPAGDYQIAYSTTAIDNSRNALNASRIRNLEDQFATHQQRRLQADYAGPPRQKHQEQTKTQKTVMKDSSLRIVRVIIADPDPNLPLENRVLHDSKEITTDLDDRELFFEINIKEKLDAHNAVRAKTIDKDASKEKTKDVFLEPLRIRDLKMTVVTVAQF